MQYAIQLKEIHKSFGDKKVLNGLNLTAQKGEVFGLLGPSGAGKTTIIRVITGQMKADEGEASINGKASQMLTGSDYCGFGIMMDDFGVYERLTCRDNLLIFARIYGLDKTAVADALAAVGLSEARNTPAGKLSKGMKSRLRLARAVMTDPTILFLDEPTSGLDPATSAEIHDMIRQMKQQGKTIFLTTHNMTEAEKLCDHIALLNEGHIIEYGAPADICRRYHHQKQLRLHMCDGTDRVIAHDAAAADVVAELLRTGALETIHSAEPDLETVFMELTGKELGV